MHRGPRIALLVVSSIAALSIVPLPASAVPIHRHVYSHKVLPDGSAIRILVAEQVIHVAPGDKDQDGVADSDDNCPNTAGSLANGCEPVQPAVDSPVVVADAPATTTVAPAPVGGCPSYMAAEASSPSAVNPSSGAAGCFQIIPSTQAAYGCGAPDASCAAAICADVGASAWSASGADPCPYVQP